MDLFRTVERGTPLRPAVMAGRAAVAVLCLAISAAGLSAQVPEPIHEILNRVDARFEDANGNIGGSNAEVVVALDRHAGPEIEGTHRAQVCRGGSVVFAHVLRNAGNVTDRLSFEVNAPSGFTTALYRDLDGDGVHQPGDPSLPAGLLLAAGEAAPVLLVVEVDPALHSLEAEIVLGVRSEFDPTLLATTSDTLELCGQASLSFDMTVDRSDAVPGDTLTYTLTLMNDGESASGGVTVTDTLPDGLVPIGGESSEGDALRIGPDPTQGSRAVIGFQYDSIAVGETREARILAVVALFDTAVTSLDNTAWAVHGTDTMPSTVLTTNLHYPRVAVAKRVTNGTSFREGETAVFELSWVNPSDAALRGAVLTDTLPEGLSYVSALPAPSRIDGAVVEWSLGSIEPGAEGAVLLTTLVEDQDETGVSSLINRVTVNGGAGAAFATAAATAAAAFDVRRFDGEELAVRKRSGALEAGVGDAILYTVEVENLGTVPLTDVVVVDLMPSALELVRGDIAGVDSVRRSNDAVRFHLSEPLDAGETRAIRYRAVVLGGASRPIENRAYALAEGALVWSDTASTRLRVREGPAAPARTLVGRVWLDENDNRIQEPGEPGVAGIDVWTAGGVIVRTDEQGRFSLQDMQPGTHILRVDTLGVGGRYRVPEDERIAEVRMNGWTMGRASLRLLPAPAPDPSTDDHTGPPIRRPTTDATRRFGTRAHDPSLTLPDTTAASGVTIAPLRSREERARERGRDLLQGPGVAFLGVTDGAVFPAGRIYVGGRGEPGAALRLFDGDSLLAEAVVRPDGVHDFVALPLERGPHRLRLAMRNSWGNERWDSIAVHRSGEPALLDIVREPVVLRAESQERRTVTARVLDEWGIPVTTQPYITIAGRNVTLDSEDADERAPGLQVRTDPDGWARVLVRAGREVGSGVVSFMLARDSASAPVDVVAPVRPLIVTGAGRIGIGATESARATITARGAIDEETSLTLSYDSRGADEDAFRHEYDALDESFYPIVGDGSERRVLSGSTRKLTARLERGRDWLALGDVRTEGFAGADELASYDRSVDGVAGRLGTGAVVWHGFGSSSAESLAREQIRGDGTSGPYRLGGSVRPGTERIALEVRARENAARVIARTELDRDLDYQIDYRTGEVLLQRPVPSTDPNGNPIFLVADVERRSGDRAWLGGLRADVDVARLADVPGLDSLAVGLSAIRDGADSPGAASVDLTAASVGVRAGDVDGHLELVHGASADSSALATRIGAGWDVREDARLELDWMRVGSGFVAGANPRLRSGLQELRLGAHMLARVGTLLSIEHERQSFGDLGIERSATYGRVQHALGERDLSVETGLLGNGSGGGSGSALSTRATLRTGDSDEVWVEANRALTSDSGSATPSHLAVGASHRVLPGVRVVGSHRQVWSGDVDYALSELTLRLEPIQDGAVWGGLQRTGFDDAGHSATFGLSQRVSFGAGWSVNGLYERRLHLDEAPLADQVRAMPFPRQEADHWSASIGADWQQAEHRLGGHAEVHQGDLNSGYRFELTGEANLGLDAAILTRHDWLLEDRLDPRGTMTDRRDRSLVAFAFRPAGSDALNALARLEWRRSDAPVAPGVFGGASFRRLIGSADLVWSPRPELEAGFRYAIRGNAFAQDSIGAEALGATSHMLGATVDRDAPAEWLRERLAGEGRLRTFVADHLDGLRGRLDARLLYSATVDQARWSLAPSLVYGLHPAVEIEAGYRIGNLDDIDFARTGDSGGFLSLQVSFTEQDAAGVAAFWRERIR